MAKFDAVDRLMSLATEKISPSRNPQGNTPAQSLPVPLEQESDAERVLEAKVSAGERGVPPRVAVPPKMREAVAGKTGQSQPTPGERGRQILGALRPFLPAVSGALRMVDHGAVQAVVRLLPLLGNMGEARASSEAGVSPEAVAANARELAEKKDQVVGEILAAFDKRHLAMAEELKKYKAQLETQEEQLRRMRDGLERTVAEQGSLAHLAHQLADRSKLLTAGVIILLMLVAADMVLLGIIMHR